MDPRQTAKELLEFAGLNHTLGRQFSDPVYKTITEGRQGRWKAAGSTYSSCADLAHWLLFRMGCRAHWINRNEHRGWKGGQNITLLTARGLYGANSIAKRASEDDVYEAGDTLVIGISIRREHVVCVISHDPVAGILETCEYGQPHGMLRKRKIEMRNVRDPQARGRQAMFINDRQVDSVLRLYDVLNAGADMDLLTEPETLAEYALQFPELSERLA